MNRHHHINIPIFIPHEGCPNTCVFCDQKKISGERSRQSPQKVKKLLEEIVPESCADSIEIAFFGGSFTGLPESLMIEYLKAAAPFLEDKRVKGIRLSTRPDYINQHIIDILKEYGVKTIELGAQSLDHEVLRQSQRGHTVEDTENACTLIKKNGLKLGIQTMLGLPGDSFKKSMQTALSIISLKPDMVRIYPVLVLKGTILEKLYLSGCYTPLSIEEAVSWCASIIPLYRNAGITVLRVGLHSSDTLEESVMAGPYHPAFGELVESRIILNRIMEYLDSIDLRKPGILTVKTHPGMLSKVIGQKKINVNFIKRKYEFKDVKILACPETEDIEIIIN